MVHANFFGRKERGVGRLWTGRFPAGHATDCTDLHRFFSQINCFYLENFVFHNLRELKISEDVLIIWVNDIGVDLQVFL